jgi:cell division protein FtsZ
VTKPFTFEGKVREAKALSGADSLKECVDSLIVVRNDSSNMPPETSISKMFVHLDEAICQSIEGVLNLISKNALIGIDFLDLLSVFKDKGSAYFGTGTGTGEERVSKALKSAVRNPLSEVAFEKATSAIIQIVGGEDLTLTEAMVAMELIKKFLPEDAKIISGIKISPHSVGSVSITVAGTGFKDEPK